MPKLILLQGGQTTIVELPVGESIVGRLPECGVQLNSNMISRRHARFLREGDVVTLEDLGSGNGTFLNGQRLTEPAVLNNEDRIKFGPILARFEADRTNSKPAVVHARTFVPQEASVAVTIATEESGSTIMGAVDAAGGFGLLDVQPEAKLKAILEISRSLAGTIDIETLLPKILDTLFTVFPSADRGSILLKDETSGRMTPRAMKHRRASDDDSVKLSRTVVNTVLQQKKAILSADAGIDPRFVAVESVANLNIRSMMCVPLLSIAGEPIGLIHIDTQNAMSQFRKEDLEILLAVAGQAALSFEGARLMQSYVEKQKQDNEMLIARSVQRALLPDEFPSVPGYEFFTTYEAAQAVGGDYYDVIPMPDGRICMAFGDVAGKGVPASLVMSRLSSAVRTTIEFVSRADEAVTRINNHMCAKAVEGRFVTFILVILDPATHRMQLANAGHMSPLIRRASGTVEEIDEETVGVPLGVLEGQNFQLVEKSLDELDSVVMYTDGVSEAMNPHGDLYSPERLRELVQKSSGRVHELGPIIRADVKRHAAGRPQNDDITLMLFGRNAQGGNLSTHVVDV